MATHPASCPDLDQALESLGEVRQAFGRLVEDANEHADDCRCRHCRLVDQLYGGYSLLDILFRALRLVAGNPAPGDSALASAESTLRTELLSPSEN